MESFQVRTVTFREGEDIVAEPEWNNTTKPQHLAEIYDLGRKTPSWQPQFWWRYVFWRFPTTPTIYRGLYGKVTVLKLFDVFKITVASGFRIQSEVGFCYAYKWPKIHGFHWEGEFFTPKSVEVSTVFPGVNNLGHGHRPLWLDHPVKSVHERAKCHHKGSYTGPFEHAFDQFYNDLQT